MGIYNRIVRIIFCLSIGTNCLLAMEQQPKVFQAFADKLYHETSIGELSNLLSSAQLDESGTIEQIFIRPTANKRILVNKAMVTFKGIQGDKVTSDCNNEQELELTAVSLIRADVAQALGGAHVSGDNLVVKGLNFGKEDLKAGDLLLVYNDDDKIKVILLFTHMPHHACLKLKTRCGERAYNCLNALSEYKDGIKKKEIVIHGVDDRLRGIYCAVLKEGELCTKTANCVVVVKSNCIEQFLSEEELQRYQLLLEKSIKIGEIKEKKFVNLQNYKKK